jgi:enterochelin esterase-like enzyme
MFSKRLFIIYIIIAFVFCDNSFSQTFEKFLIRVNITPLVQRQSIVDSFIQTVKSFPFIENDSTVNFIYLGSGTKITVPGDANGWDGAADAMTRVSYTNFCYKTTQFESDARLDYKFVVDGNWILDPLNTHQVSGGYGPNSELRMPRYVLSPEIDYYPYIPHGNIKDTSIYSKSLGNSRSVKIYTPPNYSISSDSLPLVLFHDGLEYISLGNANNVLDYLISQRRIQPVIGVFVPPYNANERTAEYAGNKQTAFISFIADELVPLIDSRYRTKKSPMTRATIGASNGGNISISIGYTHPEIFGNIGAYSSYIQPNLFMGFQSGPKLNLKFYLDIGTYDLSQLIPLVKGFVPILQVKGYEYRYYEFHEGHSWGNWRAHLSRALTMFFPGAVGVEKNHNNFETFRLYQNYPNPFNPSTSISFDLPKSSYVRIKIFNILGQEVDTILEKYYPQGSYSIKWNGQNRSTGIYYYKLECADYSMVKKMVISK